jgi:hypothetical protein
MPNAWNTLGQFNSLVTLMSCFTENAQAMNRRNYLAGHLTLLEQDKTDNLIIASLLQSNMANAPAAWQDLTLVELIELVEEGVQSEIEREILEALIANDADYAWLLETCAQIEEAVVIQAELGIGVPALWATTELANAPLHVACWEALNLAALWANTDVGGEFDVEVVVVEGGDDAIDVITNDTVIGDLDISDLDLAGALDDLDFGPDI